MDIVYYWAKFFKKVRLSSVKKSIIDKTAKIESGCNVVNVKMNKYSFCGYNCEIFNAEIGAYCSIANNVIIGGAMHPMDWVSTSPVFYEGRDSVKKKYSEHKREEGKITIIEHDVWIGQYVLIKQGVRIGVGAVIGMGSVVTKDVDPYAIVAGNPAKLIRKRFSDEIILSLLNSHWWDFDDIKLKQLAEHIKNPDDFIANLNQ